MKRFTKFMIITVLVLACLFTSTAGDVFLTQAQPFASVPILLVVNDSAPNVYGRYIGEILRAEGLNSYDVTTTGVVTEAVMAQYRVVILAETPLTGAQAAEFSNYVSAGGYLIAMRPDSQITSLFGLGANQGTQVDGYLAMTGTGPSLGLPTATLQIHGTVDRYTPLAGASTLAQLYSDAVTSTPYPAVLQDATGHGTAFIFDLASNIILMRQGNPANANIDVDGDTVLRTIDLFEGVQSWVDLNKVPIPQADEQQRLFARVIQQAINANQPTPQMWYFPGTSKTVLITTADAHANPPLWYQDEIDVLNTHNAKATFYLSIGGGLTDADVQGWRAQGHEFGIHPYAFRPDPYPPFNITNLNEGYDVYTNWYTLMFTSPMSPTVRNHQVAWLGWTDAADIALAHGLAMDTNFYHWGAWLQKPDTTWAHGYLTGSGKPMKFIRADGTILPYYQQLTQLVDEQIVSGAGAGYENLTPTGATLLAQQLINASESGDYAAIMTQFHVDYFGQVRDWVDGTLAYAGALGIPMWNADSWLSFTQTRHDADYSNISWNTLTQTLTFDLTAAAMPAMNFSTMIPLSFNGSPLVSVTVDGVPAAYTTQTIKGANVAFVNTSANNHAFTAVYLVPVVPTPIPSVIASSGNSGTIELFDPAMSKIGFLRPGQLGVKGEQIEWIVTVSNKSNVTGNNIVISDRIVDGLRVDKVVTPVGQVTVNGQDVTVTIANLFPKQTIQFSIFTTSLKGVDVKNTACLRGDGVTVPRCATGLVVSELPTTGGTPWWRGWFVLVIGTFIGMTLLGLGYKRVRSQV